MRAPVALLAGVTAAASAAGVLLVATSSSAAQCPAPLQGRELLVHGVVSLNPCEGSYELFPPGCDPGPCDPTAAPPQE